MSCTHMLVHPSHSSDCSRNDGSYASTIAEFVVGFEIAKIPPSQLLKHLNIIIKIVNHVVMPLGKERKRSLEGWGKLLFLPPPPLPRGAGLNHDCERLCHLFCRDDFGGVLYRFVRLFEAIRVEDCVIL